MKPAATSPGTEVAVQHGAEAPSFPVVRPDADVFERDDAFIVTMDLPGVTESDLEIRQERSVLSVVATRRRPEADEEHTFLREFGSVRYVRTFRLPNDGIVDNAHIGARLASGVLEITLPKAKAAQPRRIPVGD